MLARMPRWNAIPVLVLCAACASRTPPPESSPPPSAPVAIARPAEAPARPDNSTAPPARSVPPEPLVPGCEHALREYTTGRAAEEINPTAGANSAALNRGTYLSACKLPLETGVRLCVAIRNGRAVGIDVELKPPDAELERCVTEQLLELTFPHREHLDITRTVFAPAP